MDLNELPESLLQGMRRVNELSAELENFNFEAEQRRICEEIELRKPSYEDLIEEAANAMASESLVDTALELQMEMYNLLETAIDKIRILIQANYSQLKINMEELGDTIPEKLLGALKLGNELGIALDRRKRAVGAANSRHGKVGGSREKRERIRQIWSTGKYTSRDICAEQECASLNMSFSSARKALRNTPPPECKI
ncbi:MAG: hypothetical protein A3H44_09810 [Gammaproteobacteria bacterium RIFCSPLOWO2_02_FULL_57_10]|nr:MAG: hypothetical protein A3H44_09810 [Gammaproteobacteria bacterium RIFCSPLOWO2_02_FULL_57_10]